MDQRCHTFLFGHYHQAPGASCGILYILVLSLVLFMQSLYIPFLIYEIFHLFVLIMIDAYAHTFPPFVRNYFHDSHTLTGGLDMVLLRPKSHSNQET